MSAQSLEVVLRHAYFHGYTCEQWAGPTRECFQQGDRDQETKLCELLLRLLFALERTTDPVLEAYLTYATIGRPDIPRHQDTTFSLTDTLVSSKTMLACLSKCEESTVSRNAQQWSYILKLLPALLASVPEPSPSDDTWLQTQSNVIIILAHIIAVGLYPERYANSLRPKTRPTVMPSISFQNGNTQGFESSQRSAHTASHMNLGFDPDATLEMDVFDETGLEEDDNEENTTKGKADGKVEIANAVLAAKIMIDLIVTKDFKRVYDGQNLARQQAGLPAHEEPWPTCKKLLIQTKHTTIPLEAENSAIQKVLDIIPRLMDHEFERKLASHVKYRELEDKGPARVMSSIGLTGLLFHIIQIRPSLRDDIIVERLYKLQQIKGSDELFYFDLWLAALTGLREATLRASCPPKKQENKTQTSESITVIINRLLWRNLVLAKLPFFISKLQEHKINTNIMTDAEDSAESGEEDENTKMNALEISLVQLKAFPGLLNACSPPVSSADLDETSSHLAISSDKFGLDGEDDIMSMINDTSYSSDTVVPTTVNPAAAKAVHTATSQDFYTGIVQACERKGLVRKQIAAKHLSRSAPKKEETKEPAEDKDEFDALLDTDMLNGDDAECLSSENNIEANTLDNAGIIDQIISQQMDAIKNTGSRASMSELLRIGLASLVHLRTIFDFFLMYLREKAALHDVYTLARLCEVFSDYPASMDLIMQYNEPAALLEPLELFCNTWTPDNDVGMDSGSHHYSEDDKDLDGLQLLYSRFGKIWMLMISVVNRFHLQRDASYGFRNTDGFCCQFFMQGRVAYGIEEDVNDYQIEELATRWLTAMGGSGGISDELLRSTSPQNLLRSIPTLFERLLLIYGSGHMEKSTFVGILSYFEAKFLNFVLMPGVVEVLCDELLCRNTDAALDSLCQLFLSEAMPEAVVQLCGNHILGSLDTLAEQQRQQMHLEKGASDPTAQRRQQLHDHLSTKLDVSTGSNYPPLEETLTTRVTPETLSKKATDMFRLTVKSGRSMYMSDVDRDPTTLWDEQQKTRNETASHYLDMVLFATVLEMNGMHWFVTMIVEQVLDAGKSGNAFRAVELGSCLIATSLVHPWNCHHGCLNLLRCLLQDVLPLSLQQCSKQNATYSQCHTLGVFVSNCLVLLHGSVEDQDGAIDRLGSKFFETFALDKRWPAPRRRQLQPPQHSTIPAQTDADLFSDWGPQVTKSPVFAALIEGINSNPLIRDIWPSTPFTPTYSATG